MTTLLKPIHYKYLKNPFLADGGELIKACLQQLCLQKVLHLEERWIYVNRRESRKRPRLFFQRGENFETYITDNVSEQFFLKAFEDSHELSFTDIRWHIKNKFGRDVQRFANYAYSDVRKSGFCFLRFFPTSKGIRETKFVSQKINYIEKNTDHLINNTSLLFQELQSIGMNIIFLNKETLDKISAVDKDVEKLGTLEFLPETDYFAYTNMWITVGYLGAMDSFGSADFGGGFDGGFDGGGGDSGGGGADGGW